MTLVNEDLLAIADLMQPLKNDLQGLKSEMQDFKNEMQDFKGEMQDFKSEMQDFKSEMQDFKSEMQDLNLRTTNIELTLENETNRNIQLLAENHITLIDKLNQSIKAADKTLMYEVQMTSLKSRIDQLEIEVKNIKSNIA